MTQSSDDAKKILPGLVRPRLLTLRKPGSAIGSLSTVAANNSKMENLSEPTNLKVSEPQVLQSEKSKITTLLPIIRKLPRVANNVNAPQPSDGQEQGLTQGQGKGQGLTQGQGLIQGQGLTQGLALAQGLIQGQGKGQGLGLTQEMKKPLPMKITDDEPAKKPGMLKIKITDQVVCTKKLTTLLPSDKHDSLESTSSQGAKSIRPVLTPLRLTTPKVPTIRKSTSPTVTNSSNDHIIPVKTTVGTKVLTVKTPTIITKKPVTKAKKLTKEEPVIKDLSDLVEELEAEAALETEESNSEEEKSKVNNPDVIAHSLLGCSSYRIMTESRVKKEIYATPDTEPVTLVPIIIANHTYLICHENQCLYSVETEEKIGTIQPDRSIMWYSTKSI